MVKNMNKFFVLFLLLTGLGLGQTTTQVTTHPDCELSTDLGSGATIVSGNTARTIAFDNRSFGCTYWTVGYNNFGWTSVSVLFEDAPDGGNTPGTFVTFAGTTLTGSNPMTSTTQAVSTFSGMYAYLRISATRTGGSGTKPLKIVMQGWKNGPPSTATATITGNVTVVGPTAPGAAQTTNPVEVSGVDNGGLVRNIATDTNGGVVPATASSALGDGISNTQTSTVDKTGTQVYIRNMVHYFNGTTWDRMRGNTDGQFIQGVTANTVVNANVRPVVMGGIVRSNNTVESWNFNGNGVPTLVASASGQDGNSNGSMGAFIESTGNFTQPGVSPHVFNGSTWDRWAYCTTSAPITLTGSGDTRIIVGSNTTRICYLQLAAASAVGIKITRGTGTNCGTGTADVTGVFQNVTTLELPMPNPTTLRIASSNDVCINLSSAVNVGGVVVYTQY